MREVVYSNLQICKYKYFQSLLGLCINMVISFFAGLSVLSGEAPTLLAYILVCWSILSLLLFVFMFPSYMVSYRWLLSRPKREIVEIVRIDAGHLIVNGTLWDVTLGYTDDIVLDCSTGIAHVPTLSLGMKSAS